MRRSSSFALTVLALVVFAPHPAGAYTVNTAADSDDGSCDAAHCSLREAINAANANLGADTIAFAIPGAGPHSIQPLSLLPEITDPVVIDGYTQPGSSPNSLPSGNDAVLLVTLDGTAAGFGQHGLRLSAGSSTVRGLTVVRFGNCAIVITAGGGNVIEGNFLGTDTTGADLGNSNCGVHVSSSSNLVGGSSPAARNVISANDGAGVFIHQAQGNLIQGNFIGTDPSGTATLGNLSDGIVLNVSNNNTIGGMVPGTGNIISGSSNGDGIDIGASDGNLVQGNYIGTDVTGTVDLGNARWGVSIVGASNTIGGTVSGARNLISGNDGGGVFIWQGPSTDNHVEGNYIGVDSSGSMGLANSGDGVRVETAAGNFVGGVAPGAGNVISGNTGNGVVLDEFFTTANHVQGNYIGVGADGTTAVGNGATGILISDDASDNSIGGVSLSAANRIAHNDEEGIRVDVDAGMGNALLSNSIYSNGNLGIDLGGDGVTPNDPGDGDTGPNGLQNFPLLTAATAAGQLIISGTLESTADGEFLLQFFLGGDCDPSGFGEGESFVGSLVASTDGNGSAPFTEPFPVTAIEGEFVTATATSADGDSSEFSPCVVVVGPLFADGFESGDTSVWSATVP